MTTPIHVLPPDPATGSVRQRLEGRLGTGAAAPCSTATPVVDPVAAFWTHVRGENERIRNEMDTISADELSITAAGRQEASERIDRLVAMARALQMYVDVASTGAASSGDSAGHPAPPALLRLAPYDVRRAGEAVVGLYKDLGSKRAEAAPPDRFRFASRQTKKYANVDALREQAEAALRIGAAEDDAGGPAVGKRGDDRGGFCGFENAEGRTFDGSDLPPSLAEGGADFTVRNLTDCTVTLQTKFVGLRMSNLVGCTISCGPVSGPVYVQNCEGCSISVASRQLRVHDTTYTTLLAHTSAGPILENCTHIRVGPLDRTAAACLGVEKDGHNAYKEVRDFGWLRHGQPSPNWCLIETEEGGKGGERLETKHIESPEPAEQDDGSDEDEL